MSVSFAEDDFIREQQDDKGLAVWQALLSDGRKVTMDDGRPGEDVASAWLRLAAFISESKLRITKLWLKFRSNCDENILPENAEGYFFSKALMTSMSGGQGVGFYLVGTLSDGRLHLQKWAVPSLVLVEREERSPDGCDAQVIRNA